MERINGFFNKSVEHIEAEHKFIIGSCYEDRGVFELEHEYNKMAFIMDNACPDKFIAISTGGYLYNDVTNAELYDNYNNTIFLIEKKYWEKYEKEVLSIEEELYNEYEVEIPDYKKELLAKYK